MKSRWQFALLALVLALFSWYLVTGREKVETWIEVPVEMSNPPEELIIRKGMVNRVEVRVRGPQGLVRALEGKRLTYSLDARGLRPGRNVIDFDAERMPIPKPLEIMEIKPIRLALVVDVQAEKRVPVIPEWQGELPRDLRLEDRRTQPDTVLLRGPKGVLASLEQVRTQPVTVQPAGPEDWAGFVALDLPEEVEAVPAQVRAELRFAWETRTAWVRVPLRLEAPAGMKARVGQDSVRLLVEGPVSYFRQENMAREIDAVVQPDPGLAVGSHQVQYFLRLPMGLRVEKRDPESVELAVKTPAAPVPQPEVQPIAP